MLRIQICLVLIPLIYPIHMFTHIWQTQHLTDIYQYRHAKQKKDPMRFDIKLSSDDIAGLNEDDLDLSAAVEMLGLEDDNEKKHPLVNHGTFLSYLALRHLRIRDLQRTVCVIVISISNLYI